VPWDSRTGAGTSPRTASELEDFVLDYIDAAFVNREISYVELTSDVTVNATTAAGANTLVTAGAFTANGTDAYWIEFECAMAQPAQTAGASIIFVIYDGASVIANAQLAVVAAYSATGVGGAPVSRKRKLTPSAASHTYSVRAYRTGADGTVRAASGTYMPAHIRITKA
jgi:hypothetical protein